LASDFSIPVYEPYLSGNEKAYVMDCLDTNWISSKGKYVNQFEQAFAQYVGVRHALSVCNGTVALHLALISLGIGAGDEVIVPTLTYIASVNAVAYTGATPIFVDSLSDTLQIDPKDVRRKLSSKTKAILPVHLYGHPCSMDEIADIATANGLFIVEDCAEAIGSLYRGCHVGSFGHISAFSFYGNKTITTGEGGMVLTNDPNFFERSHRLRGQGLARNREYWHNVIGYNYRMTNICAAIGLAQIENIDEILARKIRIAEWYQHGLKQLPVTFHGQVGETRHTFWMITILVEPDTDREDLRGFLKGRGIETRPVFYPIHTMPMYSLKSQTYPIAESIASRGINLPSYPGLSRDQVDYICACIREYFGNASGRC
jgi:perosamine synthetase